MALPASERLGFAASFEALFRLLGPRSAAVTAQLRALGVDPDSDLHPAYPIDVFLRSMDLVARTRWPDRSFEDAHLALGRAMVSSYAEGMLGRAAFAVLKLIGPERSLARMTRSLMAVNNYTETKLTRLGPGHFELWINVVYSTDYYRGVILEGFVQTGVAGCEAALLQRTGESATYSVRWPAR